MEIARPLASLQRVFEPRSASSASLALAGVLLTLLFWLLHAAIDYLFFGAGSRSALLPDAHRMADLSLVLLLVCCLLFYSRRAHRVQAALELALKEALQEAESEKAKLDGIIEAMGDAISIQDRSMTVLYQNQAHQELMGSHVGRRCYEAYRHQSEICADCHLMEAFQDGKVHRAELNMPCTLSERCLQISASVLNGPEGDPVAGIQVVRDVTDRRLAEQEAVVLNQVLTWQTLELNQANRELEAFCQAISHDLRAPLTRVYSSAQELQRYGSVLDEDGNFFVTLVNEGCVQMEALLDALMVLCRVTEVDLVSAPVDLTAMVQQLVAQLRQADPSRKVSLLTAPRLMVQGDPQLLLVAMTNLIANAWKYSSGVAEPVIELGSFDSEEGETVLFVRDNGAGFDSARSDELFQPFRRLHSARQFPGTGLGLATVRRIIRRHNGRVWGEGKPGCGATFYFTLNC